ncbi:GNAT family N-acetyltransferase, partial [Mesorhizobium sp. M7A.F.Ca.CA.004.01.1.1]
MITFRRAQASDLPDIIAMLADDPLGAGREDASMPLAQGYVDAFNAIDADPNQLLAVTVDGAEVIGTLQISFLAGLSRKGAWRGQIEAVRVAGHRRSDGIGRQMIVWA